MEQNMTRCPEGHFYDPSKNESCPWCLMSTTLPREVATLRYDAGQEQTRVEPVVGWLVCISGPDRGKDYRLHTEKNFLGRSPRMDVVIENDPHVSREKHGVVVYDPKKKVFWVLPGEAAGLVYLNGEMVNAPAPLARGDTIELGYTKLMLVPLCGDQFDWTGA